MKLSSQPDCGTTVVLSVPIESSSANYTDYPKIIAD